MRILVLDSITRLCLINAFKASIAPEIPADIQVDYACGWQDGLKCFSQNKYDLVVIESILVVKEIDIPPSAKRIFAETKAIIKKSGGPVIRTVQIPGFTGEKISKVLIGADECIRQMQAINPETKYIVACHLRSGYSRENRKRLDEMIGVLAVVNHIAARTNKPKVLKLIRDCARDRV